LVFGPKKLPQLGKGLVMASADSSRQRGITLSPRMPNFQNSESNAG
jgi:hypothetical protein